MADLEIGSVHGYAAVATGDDTPDPDTNINGETTPQAGFLDTDQLTISALRTRLDAIDSGLYTAAYMNTMTKNDMVYAVRQNDHATTVKQ